MAICRVLSDREEVQAREAIEEAGYTALDGSIPERLVYREAQDRGLSMVETTSAKLNSRAGALLDALLRKVMEEVKRMRSTPLRRRKIS